MGRLLDVPHVPRNEAAPKAHETKMLLLLLRRRVRWVKRLRSKRQLPIRIIDARYK